MSTILPFKRVTSRSLTRAPAPAGGATIVIFPGVRYERRDGKEGQDRRRAGDHRNGKR